jgi:hypothetical protein
MEGHRFDLLAKMVAQGSSRRRLIGRVGRLGGAVVALAGTAALGVRGQRGTSAQDEFALDHFKCYDVSPSEAFTPIDVELKDQFSSGRVRVGPPDTLCNPVGKNGAEIQDPDSHLTCYPIDEIDQPTLPPEVVVDNQFGSLRLKMGNSQRLCVPSRKTVPPDGDPCVVKGDHYTCYTAKAAEGAIEVLPFSLKDQFGATRVRIRDPRVVCTPTDKNDEGIADRELHYECRQIVASSPAFKPRKVTIENQLGTFTFAVEKPDVLCAPSCKSLEGRCDAIPEANHYQCYTGSTTEGEVKLDALTLKDQFDSGEAKVDVPRLLCAPVDKSGSGIIDDALHFAVHPITPGAQFEPRKAFFGNQFGQTLFEIEAPELLFVPSCKTVLG